MARSRGKPKRRAIPVVFSEIDPDDVRLWNRICEDKEADKPINFNRLIKMLLRDWYVQRDIEGTLGTSPIWQRGGVPGLPRPSTGEGERADPNDPLVQAAMSSMFDL